MIGVLIDTNDRIIAALENYDAVSFTFIPLTSCVLTYNHCSFLNLTPRSSK